MLDAASKAPSGGNTQPARFLVIRERDRIEAFGKLYHEAWWAKRRDEYGWKDKSDMPEGSVYTMAALLADEMADAPVVILAFTVGGGGASSVFHRCSEFIAGGAGAGYRIGVDDAACRRHGTGVPDVRYPADAEDFHCCIPLVITSAQFRATRRLCDGGYHGLEQLECATSLEVTIVE